MMRVPRGNVVRAAIITVSAAVLLLQGAPAQATLIESWENTLDGWTVIDSNNYSSAFSTKTGVTDGTYSLALTGTQAPGYGQMLRSQFAQSYTTILGNSSSLSLDVFGPASSFGGFLQFDFDINNNDTGFVSLDSFSYPGISPDGNEHTITVPISPSLQATLAASSNPTQIIIQIGGGFTAGNETMYLDNLRTVDLVPEPSTIALLATGLLGLVCIKRRRVS
jgi:hypothetical protein